MEEEKIRNFLEEAFHEGNDRKIAELLDEGHFKSYPTDKFLKGIADAFDTAKEHSIVKYFKVVRAKTISSEKNDINPVNVQFVLESENYLDGFEDRFLDRTLGLYGWYIGEKRSETMSFKEGTFLVHTFLFEAKFPKVTGTVEKFTEQLIKKYKCFYHTTFAKFEKKIAQSGLLPMHSKNAEFSYPDRVYLFTEEMFADEYADYYLSDENKGIKRRMSMAEMRTWNKGRRVLSNIKPPDLKNTNLLIYKVDLQKAWADGKKIWLYADNRSKAADSEIPAVFTNNTIPPKYLTIVSRIEVF